MDEVEIGFAVDAAAAKYFENLWIGRPWAAF